jgi:DNA-binding Xre family transcriptional regulator
MSELPKPISITKDRVVLSRAGWNAILEALEDSEDRAAVRASLARAKAGENGGLPVEFYRRIRAGEHPIRAWRAYRKLSLNALAAQASVAPAYLSEIETAKKPGSVAAIQRIARALGVDIDDLVRSRNAAPSAPRPRRARRGK